VHLSACRFSRPIRGRRLKEFEESTFFIRSKCFVKRTARTFSIDRSYLLRFLRSNPIFAHRDTRTGMTLSNTRIHLSISRRNGRQAALDVSTTSKRKCKSKSESLYSRTVESGRFLTTIFRRKLREYSRSRVHVYVVATFIHRSEAEPTSDVLVLILHARCNHYKHRVRTHREKLHAVTLRSIFA